jgi:hypothetical protein
MIVLFVLIVIAFLLLYVQSYFKMQKETQIIQTTLSTFHPDLLLEKQPIYVNESIYNPADVIGSVFKFQYIQKVLSLSNRDYIKKNLSRFVLIYNDSDNIVEVDISNPHLQKNLRYYNGLFVNKFYKVVKSKTESIDKSTFTKILLKPYNMIVLPMNWLYQTNTSNLLEIHLFDMITKTYSFFA